MEPTDINEWLDTITDFATLNRITKYQGGPAAWNEVRVVMRERHIWNSGFGKREHIQAARERTHKAYHDESTELVEKILTPSPYRRRLLLT